MVFKSSTGFSTERPMIRNDIDEFEPHINSIEWAEQIVKTLDRSRNVIMHSDELINYCIERIGCTSRMG